MRRYYGLILMLGLLSSCHKADQVNQTSEPGTPVFSQKLNRQTLQNTIEFPARVQAERQIELGSEVAGIVTNMRLLPGDGVRHGQVLLEVQNPDPLAGFRPYRVLAPFAGEVGRVYVQVGDRIVVGQKLLQLVDPASLRFQFQMISEDIARLQKGMTGEWSTQTGEQSYPIIITAVGRVLDDKIGTSTGELRLQDRKQTPAVASGLLGIAKITANIHEAVLVPEKAIFYKDKKAHVIVIDDASKARYAPVFIISHRQDQLEIQSDLPMGTAIVSQASSYISEGEALQVTEGGAS